MNFKMFTELYSHHHDLILDHFHHSKKNLCVYLPSLTTPTLRQALIYFLSVYSSIFLDLFCPLNLKSWGWVFKGTVSPCHTIWGSPSAISRVTASVAGSFFDSTPRWGAKLSLQVGTLAAPTQAHVTWYLIQSPQGVPFHLQSLPVRWAHCCKTQFQRELTEHSWWCLPEVVRTQPRSWDPRSSSQHSLSGHQPPAITQQPLGPASASHSRTPAGRLRKQTSGRGQRAFIDPCAQQRYSPSPKGGNDANVHPRMTG